MKVLVVLLGVLYVKLDKYDIFISFIYCYEFEEMVLCDVCINLFIRGLLCVFCLR